MDFSKILQFLPYAERMHRAGVTYQRLMKDPDVIDAINLYVELTALAAKMQQPDQHG